MDAENILKLQEKWNNTQKGIIVDNMERYLIVKDQKNIKHEERLKAIMEITGDKKQTVYAWINRSRTNVKVPFIKLCKIAAALNVNVEDMLSERKTDG